VLDADSNDAGPIDLFFAGSREFDARPVMRKVL